MPRLKNVRKRKILEDFLYSFPQEFFVYENDAMFALGSMARQASYLQTDETLRAAIGRRFEQFREAGGTYKSLEQFSGVQPPVFRNYHDRSLYEHLMWLFHRARNENLHELAPKDYYPKDYEILAMCHALDVEITLEVKMLPSHFLLGEGDIRINSRSELADDWVRTYNEKYTKRT